MRIGSIMAKGMLVALSVIVLGVGFLEGIDGLAIVFVMLMLTGGLILLGQSIVARLLGCGMPFRSRDIPGFFLLRFVDPEWLVYFESTISFRKAWTVVLSGLLMPGLIVLLIWGGLCVFRVSTDLIVSAPSTLSTVGDFILLYGMLAGLICILFILAQGRALLLWREYDRGDILISSWICCLVIELGRPLYGAFETITVMAEEGQEPRYWMVMAALLHRSTPEKAADYYSRAYDLGGLPREAALRAADGCVTCALFSDPKPLLPKLDQYSQELLVAQPENLSFHGTRGSVLIELGRLEEGKRMLEGVLAQDENKFDRAISAVYLAYAAHREQRSEDVARYVSLALEADSENPIFKRFAFLLPKEKSPES